MTDLIVGIASGYDWFHLEPFVVSLRRSGYKGECILLFGEGIKDRVKDLDKFEINKVEQDLYNKLKEYHIQTYNLGQMLEHPILARFPAIANILDITPYRLIICVDTKDIVFQSNPINWLDENLRDYKLCVVSEGYTYESNVGNKKNAIEAFGQDVYQDLAKEQVLNAGVIAGEAPIISRLLKDIYSLCSKDLRLKYSTPGYNEMISDQTAMNILLRKDTYRDKLLIAQSSDGFVFEGVFDKIHKQQDKSEIKNGISYPKGFNIPFAIFHQYFAWLEEVRNIYKE